MRNFFKYLINKLLITTIIISVSISASAQQYEKSVARVQKNNGVYVFCDSEPMCKYEILDREKSNISWTGQYNEIRNKLIRKAVNTYSNTDGVVITMSKGFTDKAIAIKFKEEQNTEELALARVNKVIGLYIFTDCEPVNEYEILGRVKTSFGFATQYQSVRDKLIRRAVRKHPNADGMIFSFSTGGTDRAAVIKFK